MSEFNREYVAKQKLIDFEIDEAVDRWFQRQCHTPEARLYLYYRRPRSGELIGELRMAEDAPGENWVLAVSERISPAWTRRRARGFVADIARSLPILGSQRAAC